MIALYGVVFLLWVVSFVVWAYYLYKTIKTFKTGNDYYTMRMLIAVLIVNVLALILSLIPVG